jgi:uncharacterized lipoprotein YmbA
VKLGSANARRFSTRRHAVGWHTVGWLAAAWLASVGCGSSPEPQFYTLFPRGGNELPSAPLQVELRRPGLPGYLDRPQIVRHEQAEELEFSANARWGAPLQDMVGSILAEDLARRLPGSSVFTEAGAISATPDALIELDLQRFELTAKGSVELLAQVAVHWPKTSAASRIDRYALSSPSRGVSTPQLVAQMSGLLAELADSIARSISAGAPEAAPAAPSVERAPAQ